MRITRVVIPFGERGGRDRLPPAQHRTVSAPSWGVTDAPAGVTFRFPATGVELEAGGKDHHVQFFFDPKNPAHFDCEWYAEKIWFGDNGLAKGYCEIAFSGIAH
jgi:hypothetical protein